MYLFFNSFHFVVLFHLFFICFFFVVVVDAIKLLFDLLHI